MSETLLPLMDAAHIERSLEHLPRATSALFFHHCDRSLAMVTAHGIEHDAAGLPHVGPGRPLTPSDERRVLDMLIGRDDGAIEILPANVLARAPGMLMWWLPPQVRPMHLKHGDDRRGTTIQTRWPSLVVLVIGRTLFLAAVAGDERPTADTPLFHAPMPNVFADGRVCTGSAVLPRDHALADMAGWNEVVFGTYWTHDNHPAALVEPKRRRKKATGGNHKAGDFWIARDGDDSAFPDSRLSPLGMKLGDWPTYQTTGRDPRRGAR